jgi:hypothetical protein
MVIDTTYLHLHPSARAVIEDSAEDRIRRIRTDRWITYARAESALASFEDLLTFPKRTACRTSCSWEPPITARP